MQRMSDMPPLEDASMSKSDSFIASLLSSQSMRDDNQITGGGPSTLSALVNDSIATDESGTHQLLFSKRLSIGNDSFLLTNFESDSKIELDELVNDLNDDKAKELVSSSTSGERKAKRRRSTLGFLDYIFNRSNSPLQEEPSDAKPKPITDDPIKDDDSGDIEPLDVNTPTGDPMVARRLRLASLDGAMEQSQKTQQDIHDWDRKMGLKRSHSKTMRLSTRSRKKLRQQVKREITATHKGRRMLS